AALFIPLTLFIVAGVDHGVLAQTATDTKGECTQIPLLYQLANYKVENITIKPLFKFLPGGPQLQQALAAAIAKQPRNPTGEQRFDTVEVSRLEADLNHELFLLTLSGQTGLIYGRHRLINCDEQARTLDIQYQTLIIARPSYLTTSYEANARREKNKEANGKIEEDRTNLSVVPFAGYNRSRSIYGGAEVTYDSNTAMVRKLELNTSGSGSSAVVQADATGSKEFSSGPFSYAEWKAAYRFSNIPTDGFELKDGTVAARVFAATRPIGPRKLFFRFGASVEGGNRQSDVPQTVAETATVISSGYGALKLYAGASLTSRKQDWKASYGLQLGNDGDDFGVDYRKHIFDAAYRLRFLPAPYKPFQLDAQFTAGSLSNVSAIPVGERFFGGNAEQEFIQGDSWRIRSNPFIRSFPQNRLNGSDGAIAVGGDRFVSINLTVAQTVWQKRLIPAEIAQDPDVNTGLGGQLLSARLYLREQAVQGSLEILQLEDQVGCIDESSDRHCLTPVVNQLKSSLTKLLSEAGNNDDLKQAIKAFTDGDNGDALQNLADAISSAKLDPEALNKPLEDAAALAAIQSNPVEGNVSLITTDDFGDPDDPDDDMVSLLTVIQQLITKLNEQLTTPNFAERRKELQQISAEFENARGVLRTKWNSVDLLRAYQADEIQKAKDALDQPSASNRKLDEILTHVRTLLKPERDRVRSEVDQLKLRLSQLAETDPEVILIRQKRETLLEYRDLLDAADTYAEKARSAYSSANDSFEAKDFYGVKIDLERLNVGFGGLLAYVTGLRESIRDLCRPLLDRGLAAVVTQLDADVSEAVMIQKNVKAAYGKLRVPKAEAKANETVTYVGRVLEVFFREANLVAVSPVVMFDAARLRVLDAPDTKRFRYGIGAGMRFSLINVDFTAGYSFNPNRRPIEPRGAFVLRMDINDLF
ncbi:MAG TPA: hypothetical protein VFY67_15750, partial [Pyrinomonadaceae bacterium]|nr:hypothetical protein [Pyrinomonadaceae bacterium]